MLSSLTAHCPAAASSALAMAELLVRPWFWPAQPAISPINSGQTEARSEVDRMVVLLARRRTAWPCRLESSVSRVELKTERRRSDTVPVDHQGRNSPTSPTSAPPAEAFANGAELHYTFRLKSDVTNPLIRFKWNNAQAG